MGAITLMEDLLGDTVTLIHHTKEVPAIKCLLGAHDILEVSLHIERTQHEYHHLPPWSVATSKELDNIRSILLLRYGTSFSPVVLLSRYYLKLGHLLDKMAMRIC